MNSIKNNFLQQVSYLLGKDKKGLPRMVIYFLILSIFDAIGIGLIGPYVSMIMDPSLLNESWLNGAIDLQSLSLEPYKIQIIISIAIIIIFLIKSLLGIFILWSIATFSYKQQVNLRSRLMHFYQSMSYIEYVGRNSSEYIYSIQALTAQFTGKVLIMGLKTLNDVFIVIAIILVLGYTDAALLGVLAAILGFVVFLYDRMLRKNIQNFGARANSSSTRMVRGINEGIQGMKEIRVLGKEHYFLNAVSDGAQEYADNIKKTDILSTVPRYLVEFMIIAFLALIVIFELITDGNVQKLIPVLAMFAVAALRLVPSITSIANGIVQLRFNKNTVFLLHQDILKAEKIVGSSNQGKLTVETINEFKSISLKNVRFKYSSDTNYVIDGVSVEIKKGESIGIMGPSGSGKTTIIDILLGLIFPNQGSITFNGNNINNCLREWQSKVAYIPQEIFIIDDTLKKNIALGLNDSQIDHEFLIEIIKKTQLKELINSLPEGIETHLGENGVRLSGGQRQRVALARALYHKRSVLVMDEATSSLDPITEKEIVKEIKMLKGDTTIIVIAHRMNTLEHCDQIYKLEKGKLNIIRTSEK
jgi:ATP-binding cassette, subfamily B, bacterial PglK